MGYVVVHLVIHPLTHTVGSEAHPYATLTVDKSQFTGPLELSEAAKQGLKVEDLDRSEGKDWRYLLGKNVGGPLFCRCRGKLVFFAAGQVSHVLSNFVLFVFMFASIAWSSC